MKSLRLFGLTLLVLLMAAPVMAAGNIGIFFDTAGTVDNMFFQRGVPFNVHVVMYNIQDGVGAVEYKLNLPPEVVVLDQSYLAGSYAFPYLQQTEGALVGVQVGFGGCHYMGSSAPFVSALVVETLLCYSPVDILNGTITLQGFPGPSGDVMPRYADCTQNASLHTLTPTPGTFSVAVDADSPSWGSVKALYNQ